MCVTKYSQLLFKKKGVHVINFIKNLVNIYKTLNYLPQLKLIISTLIPPLKLTPLILITFLSIKKY